MENIYVIWKIYANLNYVWCLQKDMLTEKICDNWTFHMFVEKYFFILNISSSKK